MRIQELSQTLKKIKLINLFSLLYNTLMSFPLPQIMREILRVIQLINLILPITLLCNSLVEIQLVTVLLQQSYKTLSPMLLDILCLIILHVNISQLNILPFLLLSLMCMNHKIFKRLIQMMNGDKLCMMSYKPLIKIRPEVLDKHVVGSRCV